MSRSGFDRAAVLCWALAVTPLGAEAGLAGETPGDGPWVGSPEIVRDFMIQNVCVDASGKVFDGISPIDGDRHCVAQRDLKAGENLAYHKHDHPASRDQIAAPHGYQRHDSFPVETAAFGVVIEHSFDFGAGEGRQFGVFDAGRGDGGDVTLLSPGAVSFAVTEDGGAGFQLFVGPDCRDRVGAAALTQSWIIALLDPHQSVQGQTVARLNDLREGRQANCPARLNAAFTRWYVRPVQYRAALGQGAPITLATLVSEHYGGEEPQSADHVERFYFTRELGSTRWERWQSPSHSRAFSVGQLAQAASDLTLSGRCSKADHPAGDRSLLMIDCREWTLVVPAHNPGGDPAGFFIDAVRARHLGGDLFTPP